MDIKLFSLIFKKLIFININNIKIFTAPVAKSKPHDIFINDRFALKYCRQFITSLSCFAFFVISSLPYFLSSIFKWFIFLFKSSISSSSFLTRFFETISRLFQYSSSSSSYYKISKSFKYHFKRLTRSSTIINTIV